MADTAASGRAAARTEAGPYRYARWDGSQRLDELTADDLLAELSDDLLAESDLSSALARLLRRGLRPNDGGGQVAGLADLMRRLSRARDELLSRYALGDVLADVRAELDEIVATERRALERHIAGVGRDAPAAEDARAAPDGADLGARRQARLDELPDDVGGRIRGLSDYDFLDPGRARAFRGPRRPTAAPGSRRPVRRACRTRLKG